MFARLSCALENAVSGPRREGSGFLARVEALRGAAALVVALCHSQLVLAVNGHNDLWRLNLTDVQGPQAIATKFLLAAFNGESAVALFFVISGLVLGLSLDKHEQGFWGKSASFIFRRAMRIYPALIVSLLFIQLWLPVIYPAPDYAGASLMFQPLFRVPQAADFFANLLFISNQMNPVIWTLKVEMEAALLLPLLHLIDRKSPPQISVVVLMLLMGLATGGQDASTQKWLFAFYLGLMLPQWGPWLVSAMKTSPLGAGGWLGGVLMALGLVRHLFFGTRYSALTPFVEGVCAMMLIASVVYHPEVRWWKVFDLAAIRTLGRLSYSFYLFHFIIHYLIGVAMLLLVAPQALSAYPIVWHGLLSVVSVTLTIPFAALCYRWIEKPFIEVGRRLTGGGVRPGSTVDLARAA